MKSLLKETRHIMRRNGLHKKIDIDFHDPGGEFANNVKAEGCFFLQ